MDSVVEATIQLIEKAGWQALTTEAVAERAGCAIGSFYQYFPNKEALLIELADRHLKEIQQLVNEFIARKPPQDPKAFTIAAVTLFFDLHRQNPRLHQVLTSDLVLPKDIQDKFDQFFILGEQWLANWLKEHTAMGARADIAAQLIVGTIDHAAHGVLINQADEENTQLVFEETVTLILAYLEQSKT